MAARQRLYNSLISLLDSGGRKITPYYVHYCLVSTISFFSSLIIELRDKNEENNHEKSENRFVYAIYTRNLMEIFSRYLREYKFNAIKCVICKNDRQLRSITKIAEIKNDYFC